MRKKTKLIAKHEEKLMIIGLIGGILAIAGVFGPWVTMSGSTTSDNQTVSISSSQSGWDLAKGRATIITEVNGQSVLRTIRGEGKDYPYVALAGGVFVLVGALGLWGVSPYVLARSIIKEHEPQTTLVKCSSLKLESFFISNV